MGKRLLRVPPTADELSRLTGRMLHLVYKNGVTYSGKLLGHTNQELTLEDGLLLKHTHAFQQIDEVIYDNVSTF